MSHIEAAVRGSKKIEAVLRDQFGAQGRGLHEFLTDVERRIPQELKRKIRFIASVRNKVVHEESEIFDLNSFNQTAQEILIGLDNVLKSEQHLRQKKLAQQTKAQQAVVPRIIIKKTPGSKLTALLLVISALMAWYFWTQLEAERNQRAFAVSEAIRKSKINNHETAPLTWENTRLKQEITRLKQELNQLKVDAKIAQSSSAQQQGIRTTSADSYRARQADTDAVIKGLRDLSRASAQKVIDESLKRAQSRLNTLGYDVGIPDGLTGPKTIQAIRDFESANSLPVNGELDDTDQALLMSDGAKRAPVAQNSLLAQAQSSRSEYQQAHSDINQTLTALLKEQTTVILGEPEVAQEANGTYSVRVPISWQTAEQKVLELLNRYFNDYNGKPLSLETDRFSSFRNSAGDRVLIKKRYVNASTAQKPYSGRLFAELQNIEIAIDVSLGSQKTTLIIAGNVNCHVTCDYATGKGDAWLVLTKGKPGGKTLSYQQQNPVVISGLTESDLRNNGMPEARLR